MKQLWLHQNDLKWLVECISQEVNCGGVVLLEDRQAATVEPNCATECVHIRWDFTNGDGWEAMWVSGPLKGRSVRSKTSALTKSKWSSVSSQFKEEVSFKNASYEQRKKAVWFYLEKYCQEIADKKC